MRVAIRADATPSVGVGHIMRCWALAEEFESRGASVSWLGDISVPWVSSAIERAGWSIDSLSRETTDELSADLVVVDSYREPPSYREGLLERSVPVIAIVDHHHEDLGPATYWVNPGPPLGVPRMPRFMDGPRFVLIRREVREAASVRARLGVEDHVTVLLGGTDSLGLGRKVALLDLGLPVYAGPGSELGGRVTWLEPGRELLELAMRSKLVVTTASVTSWEMIHAGVPTAVICAVDNQRGNFSWMTAQGWATGIDLSSDLSEQISALVKTVDSDPQVGQKHVDGQGAARVVSAVLSDLS